MSNFNGLLWVRAFCNPADVEAFTEEKKQSLLTKRHAKGSDFVRAVKEIIESYDKLKQQELANDKKVSEDVTLVSGRDTVEPLQDSEIPTGASLETQAKSDSSQGRGESTLLSEDASAAEQMLALRDSSLAHEQACDSTVGKEPRKIATYSSRKRDGGAQPQRCAPQKTVLSSRLESDRPQSSMLPYKDCGQSIDDMDDGSLRRKRTRRSPGHSESDDVGVPAVNSNGSDEENASEIATVESDNNNMNEGNDVDSSSKVEHSEVGGQCREVGHEVSNGLDFQINTMVVRKKRKPTRKRGTSDILDPPAKVEAEAGLGQGGCNDCQTSHNSRDSLNERPLKENGDEHLPLVKRARVRMSRAFCADDEINGSSQVEERSSKDTGVNETVLKSPSSNHDNDVSSHDTSAVEEYKSLEECAKLSGDTADVVPSFEKKHSESMPPFKSREQIVGVKRTALELRWSGTSKSPDHEATQTQSKQFSSSPDGEALIASAADVSQECTGAVQSLNLQSSECDPPVVQSLHHNDKSEAHMENNTVASSVDNYGFCSGLDTTLSGLPAHSVDHQQSQDQNSCNHLVVNSGDSGNDEIHKNDDLVVHVVQSETVGHSPVPCQMVTKQEAEKMQLKEDHESPSKELDSGKQIHANQNPVLSRTKSDMSVEEAKPPYETGCEDTVANHMQLEKLGEIKEERKEQIQSVNSVSLSENISSEKMDLSPANIADSPARGTPHSNSVCHISTAESANVMQNNGSCSPNVHFSEKKISGDPSVNAEEQIETRVSQGHKFVGSDMHSALESFESALGSLVRTKESIGRATRLAVDLVKFGVSAKAMEVLAHTLESESNLERRVDLFFLVDSIAQCSKGLKGDAGGIYLSAIQGMLPRLLAAAVPAGATTQENRRQCLKVLRLWLERRILPDSTVRHHIRELDSHSIAPACLYSRRSARTERALDDPVRDMEGMLVDEYGSNSTLQLPGFCLPAMLKEEDAGSDSDGGDFEAVTPEHDSRTPEKHVTVSTAERHTHVLEDVDGELEMEDVAPSWEAGSRSYTDQADNAESSNSRLGQQLWPISGVSQQHVPSSSPPLPSSPPPPPPPAPPSQHAQCAMPDSYSNGFDCGGYPSMHGDHQAGHPRMNPSMPTNTMHYQGPESSYSSSRIPPTNSVPQGEGSNFQHNRPFTPHPPPCPPPPPLPPHQYSYMHPGHHLKSRRDGTQYSHRSHYTPSFDERNFHDNHERMRPAPYDNRDNWRYPPPSSYGPRYHDRHKGTYPPASYSGSPREYGRFQNHRWNYPPRPHNNRHSFHYKPHSEGPVPVGMRDQGVWHQR
ncbi:PREDICTED: protein HUA2-LIKE 2-like [Tarenaya hassleriana]|uniref:protein HUA2-LIKE 2-like n=1 Tax=Tarenaya hassleriana TaxID=28532 RepID=UPI0008FD4778|nr:PREDICTED: protein HUA2-LIKE 2-like [Tarenaya hassleriana]